MIEPKDYTNPYGAWEVTTESDCSGMTTDHLGVFEGYVDDIAFALAEKCGYSLKFRKISTDIPIPTKTRDKINITLDIESKTWEMSQDERIKYFQKMLQGREVYVSEGSAYASVTLSRQNLESLKREIALAKLTTEEKALLGLK